MMRPKPMERLNRLLLTVSACGLFGWCAAQTSFFVDHSVQAGLAGDYLNHTASVADYDLDGDLDVYIGSRLAPNTLYRNEGNAEFVAVPAGVEDDGFTMASLFFDYDNDGDPDLFSCNTGDANRFWRNDGGAFTDITSDLGLGSEGQCRSVHAADVNLDGWLDLYVVNMNEANEFWMSDGEGGFTDGYLASGATDNLIGMGALFLDIENDGDLDLYLTHDGNQANKLYINDGTGSFTNQAGAWGLNLAAQGMGVDATDLNHDGYLDLYISNNLPNDLFINPGPQGDGPIVPFENITETAGVGDWGMGWGTAFIDHDHDGERDLYVANEYFFSPYPNLLYHNNGDLTFTDIAEGHPIESQYSGYATVVADFDENGTEDLLVVNTLVSTNPGCQLFLNEDLEHHWIGFELEGVVSPRDAAGARVVVHAAPDFVRTDQSFIGYSYSSCGPLTFNFGLADHASVDSVEFFWPSGLRTVMLDPQVDAYHTVLETPCLGLSPELDWPETVQLCPGDSAVFSIPDGWAASSWTGGEDGAGGRVFSEPGIAQALLSSGNGCSVLSPAVPVSVVAAEPPVIELDGPSKYCSGTIRRLTVQGQHLDVLWSNGIGTDTLYQAMSDTLTVQTTNLCGHVDISEPVMLAVFDAPLEPIIPTAVVPTGTAYTFEPTVLDDAVLHWHAPWGPNAWQDLLAGTTETVGPFISSGPTFTTAPLGGSTGWWVQAHAQRDIREGSGGKLTSSSGGFIDSDTYGLRFDVHEPIVIETVRMRAGSAGQRVIHVTQPQLGTILSKTVSLEAGWNTVNLGFALEAGEDYGLMAEAEALDLWRDNAAGELAYPYDLEGMATITSSTIPNAAGLGYYYFFYDWSIRSQGLTCKSDPVVAFVEVVDGLSGCTYAFAVNYNPLATLDDGSCYLAGCLDPNAVNYNPDAAVDDGSCAVECAEDVDGDGQVGTSDLLTLLSAWGAICD